MDDIVHFQSFRLRENIIENIPATSQIRYPTL